MPQKRNIQSREPSAQAFGHNSPKKYSIWQNDNRKIWLALALLIAGLVLTCAAALYVKRGVESTARKEFDFACGEIKNRISTRLRSHAQLLRSGSAFFESADEITREAWTNFITRQKIERNLPGIQGIGYSVIIPIDELARHERKIRNEGFPQYAVKPTGKRDIYTSIIYLEPFSERNLRAFGYDMFSEPIRRKAMEHARDFDEATLSGKVNLVQETDKDIQAGTLMYVPVYEKGTPVRSIEERRRAIRGWVYSPYRMNDLMRGILGAWELGKGRQIRLEVFDDTSFQSKDLLYDSSPGQKPELTYATIFNEQTSILFNNHYWNLRFTQIGDRTGIVDYSKTWYVLIGGTLVCVLLFILFFLLINAVYRAHTLADALTKEFLESTERKRAEEMLRESEEKYRWLLNNIADVITVMDMNLRFTYVSPSIMRMRGYTAEEATAQTFEQVMTPESLQISAKVFEEEMNLEASGTADPGRIRIVELEQYRKDGSIVLMENSLSFLRDKAQKAVGIISVSRDITERKQAENALRGSEEKYRSILETIREGYYEIDLAGNLIFFNDSLCRILGYSKEELVGMNYRQYEDKESLKKVFLAYNKVYKTGEPIEGFYRQIIRKDGTKRYGESSVSLQKDSSGKPIGFRGLVRDITERKQAEKKLRESETSYRQLFDNSPALIYRVDFKSGKFLKANDVFCKYLGCSREEITSLNPYDILTEESKKLFLERLEKISQGVKVSEIVEYEVLDKKGKRWCLQLHNKNIYDTEGNVVASDVVAHDITERKLADAKLQQTLESLRKAFGATIQVMVSAVEMRDPYTSGHQVRVADLARAIAMEMGLPQDKIDGIRLAGSIHDIGKLSIPAEILSKPTKLTNLEFSMIKEHPQKGYDMLKDVESPWPLAQIVYQHHERMNGSGYPRNLKGDEILMEARIMAVADVVEAMASHRPYRQALGIEAALQEIEKNRGIFYDSTVADACLKLFREKGFQLT